MVGHAYWAAWKRSKTQTDKTDVEQYLKLLETKEASPIHRIFKWEKTDDWCRTISEILRLHMILKCWCYNKISDKKGDRIFKWERADAEYWLKLVKTKKSTSDIQINKKNWCRTIYL